MARIPAEREEGVMLPGLESRVSRRPELASGAIDRGVMGLTAKC